MEKRLGEIENKINTLIDMQKLVVNTLADMQKTIKETNQKVNSLESESKGHNWRLRGNYFKDGGREMRVTMRGRFAPKTVKNMIGFRLVRTP